MMNINGQSILLTGGTGSFGKRFIRMTLDKYPNVKKIVIYSRDELKQYELSKLFSAEDKKKLRFFLGDVRDSNRLMRANEGIDLIVHAAALKQVPAAEYNPFEFIKTNVIGAQNLIDAALHHNVKRIVALSTDKAAAPINLYGATKLCSDKLFVAANNIKGERDTRFSVVRYGNVIGSRGSVIPFFLQKQKEGMLPITHPDMTRFNLSLTKAVELVHFALQNALGGEIFVPKIPSYKLKDVAQAIGPNCEHRIIGIRPGEKMHEEMVTSADAPNTIELEKHYVICSPSLVYQKKADFLTYYHAKPVPDGFTYNSEDNQEWLSVASIRQEIMKHVDPNFKCAKMAIAS